MNNSFSFRDFINYLSGRLETLGDLINSYISGLSGTDTAAIILLLIAVVLALGLAVVWYVKSIVSSIQSEKEKERAFINRFENRLDRYLVSDKEDEEETPEDVDNTEVVKRKLKRDRSKMSLVSKGTDFDWNRKASPVQQNPKFISPETLTYQLKPIRLSSLLGLIVDLLERDVDEPKIAQSIMSKNQHLSSEDEIIQIITAIKFFIYLCVNSRFQNMETKTVLPQEDAALFHLANADGSLAMALLENLIDVTMKKIKTAYNEAERDKLFNETSNLATIFGSIAAFSSVELAAKAFELAIESNPKNLTAWGRLGDMYTAINDTEKAVWAYRNVLSIASDGIYTQQTANANKMLAIYYAETGNKEMARQMREKSEDYYKSIGINQPLTEKESAALEIIESNRTDNMESIIEKLFSNKNFKQSSYL